MRERGVELLGGDRHLPTEEPQTAIAQQRPGHEAGFGEDLEPVADPQHEPALGRERADRAHDRAEPRDDPGTQVVAVGEAAGQHDGGDAVERGLLVPQFDGLCAGAGERVDRVPVAVAAREDDDADADGHPGPSPAPPPAAAPTADDAAAIDSMA